VPALRADRRAVVRRELVAADVDWKENRLYRLIRRHQPEAMIINNTGLGEPGKIGHPEVDSVTYEQGLPQPVDRRGAPKYVAGEMCQTLNAHWGIGNRDFNYLSTGEINPESCLSRKVGANYLLNLGPTAQGGIPELEAALLRKVGQWVALHAAPLHEGRPIAGECSGRDFVLQAGNKLYCFAFDLGIAGPRRCNQGVRRTGRARDFRTQTPDPHGAVAGQRRTAGAYA